MLNCLAAAIPGGDRVISRRGGLRAALPPPRLGADADPAGRARGHRRGGAARPGQGERCGCGRSRIIVGEVRAEECLDLLLALNAGLPGMATLHANSAREALVKMCTLPLLAGENISARFVVPTVASLGRPRRPPRHRPRRRTPRQRDRRRARAGGERHHRDRAAVRTPWRRAACARGGMPPRLDASSGRASTYTELLGGRAEWVSLLGLGVGVGLLLIWSAFTVAAAASRRPRRPRLRELLDRRRAGRRRRPRGLVAAAPSCSAVVALVVIRCCLADAAGGRRVRRDGGVPAGRRRQGPGPPAPARVRRGVAGGGRQPGLRGAGRACRCPRRWPGSASAGPSRCGRRSRAFALDYQVTGRFGESPRPAQGAAGRPGRRPGRRGAAGRPRGRRRRPRPAAAQPVGLPARRRPHPRPSSRRGRPGRSTAPGSRWPRRGWCCCCMCFQPRGDPPLLLAGRGGRAGVGGACSAWSPTG